MPVDRVSRLRSCRHHRVRRPGRWELGAVGTGPVTGGARRLAQCEPSFRMYSQSDAWCRQSIGQPDRIGVHVAFRLVGQDLERLGDGAVLSVKLRISHSLVLVRVVLHMAHGRDSGWISR